MVNSNLTNRARAIASYIPHVASVAALVGAFAALHQASSTSEQVEVFQLQTLVSQYAASVEMLGNAEISVRIGAIQALGLLAREHPERFHIQTVQLLSALIREPPPAELRPGYLRADVQAALDVIIYRSAAGLELEKEHRLKYAERPGVEAKTNPVPVIDLHGSDLRWAHLYDANLEYAVLNHADLSFVDGRDASFSGAFLLGVTAIQTILPSSNFDRAIMTGARLSGGDFRNSSFVETEMPWQMVGTVLEATDLTESVVAGTDLTCTNLNNADLSGVRFQPGVPDSRVLYTGMPSKRSVPRCPVMTQAQLDSAIANPANPPLLPTQTAPTEDCRDLVWKTNDRGEAWAARRRSAKIR